MTTIDFRTRSDSDVLSVDLGRFVDEQLPGLVDSRGAEAGRAAIRLGLLPLSFDVEGEQFTLVPSNGALDVRHGLGEALVAALDPFAFSELVNDE
ncbi:MAG: hypothetical protein ACLQRH_22285 [Acidimicrobiales bacterium]